MPASFSFLTDVRKIVDSLSQEEVEHMRRVGFLVGIMAKKLSGSYISQKNSDEYQYFGEAAIYHDIGKAWVPRSILTKPDELTLEEMAIVHRHTMFAKRLFEQINNGLVSGIPDYLLQLAADSAVYHHEWWNGKGYPYGLRQNEIPLIARITSVCDAYDAITNSRTYRKAKTHYYACCELKKSAGIQFDPKIAGVFLDNEREFSGYVNNHCVFASDFLFNQGVEESTVIK